MADDKNTSLENTYLLRIESTYGNQWAFILPLLAFLLITQLYPKFVPPALADAEQTRLHYESLASSFSRYLAAQIVVATLLLAYFYKIYFRSFSFRISPLAFIIGIAGVVLWVGVCSLGIESKISVALGLTQATEIRSSFDPFLIENRSLLYLFLALRFLVLVLVVPIVEELLVRGWLARFATRAEWWKLSLHQVNWMGIAAVAGYSILTHPGEAFAAVLWFSLISWLMIRTGSIWDCMVAHAITNLLLGIYILYTGAWHLW